MAKPTPAQEIPPKLKDAAEKEARKLVGGKEYYVIWNDVRYGPFALKK